MCKREVMSDRRFCHWCHQFLLREDRVQCYAGFGRRLAAYLIDFIVPYVVLVVAVVAADSASDNGVVPLAVFLLVLVAWVILQVFFWTRGQSFGKFLVKATVIQTNGQRVGFWTMAVRELVAKFIIVGAIGIVTFGFGWLVWNLWALWDKDSQTLHDKFISTLVVHG